MPSTAMPTELDVPGGTLLRRTVWSELAAVFAVAKKEWTIFVRYPSWLMAFVVWPLLFPLMYIFTGKALSGPGGSSLAGFRSLTGTGDYVSFVVLGSTMYMWLNITLWDVGIFIRNEQQRGTLESNWLCPVSRLTLLVGASLSKLGPALLFLAITVPEFRIAFGVWLVRGNLLLFFAALLLIIPSIYGIGILFASLVLRFKEANALVFLVRGTFMVFCGVTVPIAILPGWMQAVAAWLPLTYAIQDMRAASLTGASLASAAPDLAKLAAFAVALPLVGALTFGFIERRARRTGSLSQY